MAFLSAYGEGVLRLALVWLNLPTRIVAHCSVATIFGLNTADCNNKSFETVPVTLRDDIKVLKFNENHLTTVENDAFRTYPMLQEIYLVRNRIRTLASDAFRGLYNLQILDLDGNALATVPTNAFHNLQAVRILRLGGNPIRTVGASSLRPLRKVEELSFENCLISRFEPRALVELRDLTELNLVNNELTWIDGSMGDLLPPHLAVMRLHRNPWKCDCKLRWFRQRVAALSWEFGRDAPTCAGPDLLRGILWSHLSAEQFACPSQIIPSGPTAFEMKPGSNITVECLVAGDPEPSVWWTKAAKTVDRTRVARNYLWTLAKEQRILSLLFLTDVGPSQAGDYKCIAENSAGRSEATYRLWVAGTDPSAPEAVVELSLGQRIVIGVSIGVTCLLFIAALLVGFLVSQRRRWVNSYKVTDAISNSNCYPTKTDSAGISKCSPKAESTRNSNLSPSNNSTFNSNLSSKNDLAINRSNFDITCRSNFSLKEDSINNLNFSQNKDSINNSNFSPKKDSINNSNFISTADSLGQSTSTPKTYPATDNNSLSRAASSAVTNKPRVVGDRSKTEARNQEKTPQRVGGSGVGGSADVCDTSGQAININHDKTLMKRVQIRVDQGRKLTAAAIDVDAETNAVRRRPPPDSFVATFGQSGPAGEKENGRVNANGIGYFVGKRTTAAAAEAKTEATTTMAEHKERRTGFQMKIFSRHGVTS